MLYSSSNSNASKIWQEKFKLPKKINKKSPAQLSIKIKPNRFIRGQVDLNNYRIILNKILSLTKYEHFAQYTKNFIKKSVLEGKQQPNTQKLGVIGQKLISDGIFIKHLAELSLEPRLICKNFGGHVRINKKAFKDFSQSLKKQETNPSQLQDQKEWSNENKQSQKQKQARFNGFSKKKNILQQQQKSKVKIITFQEYIKTNRKSIDIEQMRKKIQQSKLKCSENRNEQYICSQNKLKRPSIIDLYIPVLPFQSANNESLSKLPIYEKNVIQNYFPSIRKIGTKGNQVKIVGEIKSLGFVDNCQIIQVAIQFQDPEIIQTGSKRQQNSSFIQNQKVVDFAVMAHLRNLQQIDKQEECMKLQVNNQIHIFITQ